MPEPKKIVQASRSEAKLYLAKSEQFLAAARSARSQALNDAALLNAVHSAISASDGLTVALAGKRSADPDHKRQIDFLHQVVGGIKQADVHVRQLRSLIAKKNMVEYESRQATPREAADAVARAERLLLWANQIVAGAK